MTRLEEMARIQEAAEARAMESQPPLTPETEKLAENKRETFDIPINVAKVDPLR